MRGECQGAFGRCGAGGSCEAAGVASPYGERLLAQLAHGPQADGAMIAENDRRHGQLIQALKECSVIRSVACPAETFPAPECGSARWVVFRLAGELVAQQRSAAGPVIMKTVL